MENSVELKTSQGWSQAIAEILLIVAIFFMHAGYSAPDNNEAHYLCKAKHYWNAEFCDGDFFLNSADAHTVFYWTFGWITQFVSLPAAAWVGRLVTWALMAFAWQRLSRQLIQRPWVSVLTAGLFVTFTIQADLAGEWIVGGVEAKGFAYVLVLLGLAEAFRGRWNATWIWLGGASAFHVIVGGWVVLALLVSWFVVARKEFPLRKMLPGLLVGGLVSLVGLIPAILLTRGISEEVARQASFIYVFERLPHHLALLHLRPDELNKRFWRHGNLLVVTVFFSWVLLRQNKKNVQLNHPSKNMTNAMRWKLLVAFTCTAVSLALCGFAIEYAFWNSKNQGAELLRFYWFRLTDFALPLAFAMFTAELSTKKIKRRGTGKRPLVGLVLVMSIVFLYLGSVTYSNYVDPIPRGDRRIVSLSSRSSSQEDRLIAHQHWLEMCKWIQKNTQEDAMFLTSRHAQSFKWYTHRSNVVTRKDIPQDAVGIVEWHRRMERIHTYIDVETKKHRSYRSLAKAGTEHLMAIAKEYPFDYILTKNKPSLAFQIAHRNGAFTLYRMKHTKNLSHNPNGGHLRPSDIEEPTGL